MIPFRFLETIASSEDSTIAPSRARLDLPRRFDSPSAIMPAEKITKPASAATRDRSSAETECNEGTNQYQTPTASMSVARIDGPKPQYHAVKTTASHAA